MKKLNLFTLILVFTATAFINVLAQDANENEGLHWYSFEDAQLKAKEDGKNILIFGMADWCPYCRKMLNEVYTDTSVQNTLYKYFYPVMLDSESEEMVLFNDSEVEERVLAAYLRLQSLPTHYFMNEEWVIYGLHPGFVPPEVFKSMLEYVGTGSHETMSFDEFLNAD